VFDRSDPFLYFYTSKHFVMVNVKFKYDFIKLQDTFRRLLESYR